MKDNIKILKWLGYKEYSCCWVNSSMEPQYCALHFERGRWFLPTKKCPADPALDYLVLQHLRTLNSDIRGVFLDKMYDLLNKRHDGYPYNYGIAHALYYQPGDYAEAARFLWE